MIKCKKCVKLKPNRFKANVNYISNDVKLIVNNSTNVQNQCNCGCFRKIKSIHSILLQKYFCSKKRWLELLGVRKNRISELTSFSQMIPGMELDDIFTSLDLNLVKSDTSRQQWLMSSGLMTLVERGIYTFCLCNGVAYWQGIHDVAAALAHLEPTPTVGELAGLLECLIKSYAPILYSKTASEVTAKANELSMKWRLLFKYFFPKASYDYDQFCESSFSIGWFMTLGFYRFGCAYICLAYTFLLIISSQDCLSSFMFRELGYIAARGYINYLIRQKIPVDFNNSIIFSNYSNSSLIVNTLVNSNKIILESEEFINASKNLYDTFNGRDFELSEFPLLYIFKTANLMQNSAPSVSKIDSEKDFIEITEPDVFARNKIRLFESKLNDVSESYSIKYRNRKRCRLTYIRRKRMQKYSLTYPNSVCTISDCVNSEIMYSYISAFKRFGCLRRFGSSGLNKNNEDDYFIYGDVSNPNILYNILDVRSPYLCTGMSLDKIFGVSKTTYMNQVDAKEVYESSLLDTNFTMWIVLTDEGYEAEDDNNAIISLNRGLEAMESLSNHSITGVTMFRGGYKGMLRSLNLPVPEPQSLLSRLNVRKLLTWNTETLAEATSGTNLSSIATSITSAAIGIENRIVRGIADMSIFNRFRNSQTPEISKVIERVEHLSLKKEITAPLVYNNDRFERITYSIKLSTQSGTQVSLRSNGRIKVNGMALHPSQYVNAVSDPNTNILISLSALFTVNCVDGLLDVECKSYGIGKLNVRLTEFFKRRTYDILSIFSIIISPQGTLLSDLSIKPFTVGTNVSGMCSNVKLTGIQTKWNIFIIKRKRLITHLLCCFTLKPPNQQIELLGEVNRDQERPDAHLHSNVAYPHLGTLHTSKPDLQPQLSQAPSDKIGDGISMVGNVINWSRTGSVVENDNVMGLSSFTLTPTGAKNDLLTNKLNLDRTVYRAGDQRGVRVFSRTNGSRSLESSSRSTASNPEARLVPSQPNPNKQIPIMFNNVFISRSTLNKRQNSKR